MDMFDPNAQQALASGFVAGAPGAGQAGYMKALSSIGSMNNKRSALQSLAMLRMKQMQDRQGLIRQFNTDLYNQENSADPLDFLGLGTGAGNLISGIDARNRLSKSAMSGLNGIASGGMY